jgi:hypothetical protein
MHTLAELSTMFEIYRTNIFDAVKDSRFHERTDRFRRAPHGQTPLEVIGNEREQEYDGDWADKHHS